MFARPILTGFTALVLACSGALLVGPSAAGSHDPSGRSSATWGPVRTLAPNPWSASIAVDGRATTTVAGATTSFPPRWTIARRRSTADLGGVAAVQARTERAGG